MTEKIINTSWGYRQTGLPPVLRGSGQTMYPEMTTFDLREQFEWLMMGNYEDPGVARPAIYRKLSNKHCKCYDAVGGSPDPNCVYCQGEGYLFHEELKMIYFAKNFGSVLGSASQIGQHGQAASYGYTDSDHCLAFMFWYDILDYERYAIPTRPAPDKLFEMKVTPGGELDPEMLRTEEWRVRSCTAHHGDNGRVEYFEIGCEKVSV